MIRAFGAQYGELKYLKLACKKLIDIYNEPEISYVYNDINLKDSDNIIVLNEGEIEEMEDHNKLMENKKRYYDMYTEMIKAKDWMI